MLLQVEGREHLPRPDEPAVYVANHQSFMVGSGLSDSWNRCFVLQEKLDMRHPQLSRHCSKPGLVTPRA